MKVVSVKFKENGRAYYFDPGAFKIKEGDFVVVTTARGTECGEVVRAAHEVPGFSREVKPVIRVADAVDVRRMRQNRADVQHAYEICEQRIAAHGLYGKYQPFAERLVAYALPCRIFRSIGFGSGGGRRIGVSIQI